MSVALFSTAYFPPVAYMAALMCYDKVLIEAKETFPKQTYRNRMEIMTAEGVRTLSVPVVRSNHSRTDEVVVDYKERWNVVQWRTLTAAYAASPYFLYYKDELEALLMARYERQIDLNQAAMGWLLKKLEIEVQLMLTLDYHPEAKDDYGTRFSPKKPLSAEFFPPYYQVFADRQPFAANLSVLDLLMNLGPEAKEYLIQLPSNG